jgi:hypothetical protein
MLRVTTSSTVTRGPRDCRTSSSPRHPCRYPRGAVGAEQLDRIIARAGAGTPEALPRVVFAVGVRRPGPGLGSWGRGQLLPALPHLVRRSDGRRGCRLRAPRATASRPTGGPVLTPSGRGPTYNEDRPHIALRGDAPVARAVEPPSAGEVVALPRVGDLHRRYSRAARPSSGYLATTGEQWSALLSLVSPAAAPLPPLQAVRHKTIALATVRRIEFSRSPPPHPLRACREHRRSGTCRSRNTCRPERRDNHSPLPLQRPSRGESRPRRR